MKKEEIIYPGSISLLENILFNLAPQNILVVRGNQSFTKSGAQEIFKPLIKKYNIIEFSGFSVNPKLEEAKTGLYLFKKNESDIIIAVGGGSVIDTAKIIKYLAIEEDIKNTSIPLIAIPTTAGTGSEATHFAVVYIDGIKHSLADSSLLPTTAIVDANLLAGQSNYQMAVSGLDAFAQGLESFWSINSTEESIKYSAKAIKLIWENLENAIKGNKEAQIKITQGSNWAGKAINIAKTTAAHALSYGFTKRLGLPHGHAVSLSLPFFVNLHFHVESDNCNDKRGVSHVADTMSRISEILEIEKERLARAILLFYKNLDISINFENLGISKDVFQEVTRQINYERLKNNPVKIDSNTLQRLFENEINSISTF